MVLKGKSQTVDTPSTQKIAKTAPFGMTSEGNTVIDTVRSCSFSIRSKRRGRSSLRPDVNRKASYRPPANGRFLTHSAEFSHSCGVRGSNVKRPLSRAENRRLSSQLSRDFTRAAVVDEVLLYPEWIQHAEQTVYDQAKVPTPQRWSGSIRNWEGGLKAQTGVSQRRPYRLASVHNGSARMMTFNPHCGWT